MQPSTTVSTPACLSGSAASRTAATVVLAERVVPLDQRHELGQATGTTATPASSVQISAS